MVIDGNPFLKRAHIFLSELRANHYPNSSTLKNLANCSKNTAQRTIYRLRDEYLVPLDYDSEKKGYFLTDKNYKFNKTLPPGKDELTALLLARSLAATIEDDSLNAKLENLWHQFISSNNSVHTELSSILKVFSSDSTAISNISDCGILKFVSAAATGESVEIRYKSPWRHSEAKNYTGKILRVHYSDGNLYLLVWEQSGQERILNAAFVKDFKILAKDLQFKQLPPDQKSGSENWLDGFGIWAAKELQDIEIHIKPPGAEYYAAQRWHEDQEDSFENNILIRRFRGMISPEIVRRILSLGEHLAFVSPATLAKEVQLQVEALRSNLNSPT